MKQATTSVSSAIAPLRARWLALTARERYLCTLAASAVGILLVWAVLLAPALRTLQGVQARRALLDGQLQQMLVLQGEARQLAAQPRIARDEAQRALQASVATLGKGAQLQISGDRAVLSLQGLPAAALANWLGQVRTNARAVPVEARLVRSAARAPAPPNAASAAPAMAGVAMPRIPASPGTPGTPGTPPDYSVNAPVAPSPQAPGEDVRWDGTLVLGLPSS